MDQAREPDDGEKRAELARSHGLAQVGNATWVAPVLAAGRRLPVAAVKLAGEVLEPFAKSLLTPPKPNVADPGLHDSVRVAPLRQPHQEPCP